MAATEAVRQEQLLLHLDEVFGPGPGATLSQRTLLSLLALPGVTAVLAGMRRTAWVADLVGALARGPGEAGGSIGSVDSPPTRV